MKGRRKFSQFLLKPSGISTLSKSDDLNIHVAMTTNIPGQLLCFYTLNPWLERIIQNGKAGVADFRPKRIVYFRENQGKTIQNSKKRLLSIPPVNVMSEMKSMYKSRIQNYWVEAGRNNRLFFQWQYWSSFIFCNSIVSTIYQEFSKEL